MSKSLTYKEHMKIPLTEREAAICEGLFTDVEVNYNEGGDVKDALDNYLKFTQATCNLRTNGIVETEHNVDSIDKDS